MNPVQTDTVTVNNPLLVILQREEEKKKGRELRRQMRQDRRRRRTREQRRHSANLPNPLDPGYGGPERYSSSDISGKRRTPLSSKAVPANKSTFLSPPRPRSPMIPGLESKRNSDNFERRKSNASQSCTGDNESIYYNSSPLRKSPIKGISSIRTSQQNKQGGEGVEEKEKEEVEQKMTDMQLPQLKTEEEQRKEENDDDEEGKQNGKWKEVKETTGFYYLHNKSLDDLSLWLKELHLPSEYFNLFVAQGFDSLESVRLLKEEDLNETGITKTGHQKKIMFWVKNHRPSDYVDIMDKNDAVVATISEEPAFSTWNDLNGSGEKII